MTANIDLKALERKVYRESLQDGIMEIAIGALMYLCGLLIADPKLVFIYALYLFLLPPALKRLKERHTYPRLGKVVLHHEKPKPLLTGVFLLLGAAALIAAGLAVSGRLTDSAWYRWLPLSLGLCLACAFAYIYARSGSLKYLAYIFVALSAAVVIGSIQLPSAKDYLAVYLICTGTLSAITGGITLIRFLRTHPPVAQEMPDENARS